MKSELKRFYQRAAASLRTAKIAPPSAHKGRLLLTLLMMLLTAATGWADPTGNWADEGNRATTVPQSEDGSTLYISTAEQLACYAYGVNNDWETSGSAGSYYCSLTVELMADIDLSAHYWTPIGTNKNYYFNGFFHGNGHVISGMNIVLSSADGSLNTSDNFGNPCIGLFGHIRGRSYGTGTTSITDLTLKDFSVNITSNGTNPIYVGGLVGFCNNNSTTTSITNCCLINGTVSCDLVKNLSIGGLVASGTPTTCANNYRYNVSTTALGGNKVYGPISGESVANCATLTISSTHGSVAIGGSVGVITDGKIYAASGETVTLSDTPEAGYMVGYTASGVTITDGAFTMPANDDAAITATFSIDPDQFSQDGNTYTIHTAGGWGVFCDLIADGESFSGKTVQLGADITVTRMAGSGDNPFCGNFDGGGNTLTFTATAADNYCAPFVGVKGGTTADDATTISNLNVVTTITANDYRHMAGLIALQWGHVNVSGCNATVNISSTVGTSNPHDLYPAALVSQASSSDGGTLTVTGCTASGTISTDGKYAAGLVGIVQGTATITDCISSVTIDSSTSGDGTHGGLVASQSSGTTITITGCVFDGRLLGSATSKCGGFIGWRGNTATIYNSLFAPAEVTVQNDGSATFARNKVDTYNSYYTYYLCDGTNYAPYDPADADHPDKYNNGHATRTVAADADVTIGAIALTGTPTQYTVSGITAYSGGGLQRGETLYYGSGDQLSLTLSNSATAPQGYQYGYTASAGTLSGTTLTMPDQDVTISVNTAALAPIDWATVNQGNSTDPYMIYNKDQLLLLAHRVNGTNGETANTYEGMYFKLGADITFDHVAVEGDDYDENYEAIGGYIGGTIRYFKGKFDGDGLTVSGIRINKTGSGTADIYQGLFGRIDSGADIHDVHLTDARIIGYMNVGGIAGYNDEGYISGCTVTDSYITATHNANYGTICGSTGYTERLRNNYYHGCTVNGTAVTSGVGCQGADITANNGALPAYRLTLGANITTPPGTFAGQTEWLDTPPVGARLAPENGFTLAGNHYFASGYEFTPGSTLASGAAQGYTPRATLGSQLLDPYTPTGDADPLAGKAIAQFTVTADCDGKTLASTQAIYSTGQPVTVAYINADGTTGEASATALDGHETVDSYGDVRLAAGTYYVGTDITYANQIVPDGNITLILADGKTMTLNGDSYGILNDGNDLTIYGQSLDDATAGTLRYDGTFWGIHANNYEQHSGNVSITTNGYSVKGIYASDDVTLRGGTLSISADGIDARAINGNTLSILGGHLTATATGDGATGIYAYADDGTAITLGWTNYSDRIYANSYRGIVSVKAGQAFVTDEATPAVIGGTVSDLAAINGKTLKPATFYLVGNMTNPEWTVNADYQLTVNPGNTSELMIQNVPLTGSTEFKVVYSANGTEATTWYPGDWYNYWISADGIYDIYFRPDYQGGDDWHFGCIYATDVSNIEVAFAPEGFATYYHGTFDVKLPEGVKARIVTSKGSAEGTLTYETIADGDTDNNKVVPAGTAVMLQTEKSTEAQQKTLTLAAHGADSPAAPTLNLLHGSDTETTTTGDGKHYKLTYGNDNTPNAEVFGWYWGAADGATFTSPAHKVWLVLPADANARSFFGLPDDDTTTIIENGKLKIENSNADAWYDLSGRKLDNGQRSMVNGQWSKVNGQWSKGIYIRGGKKVVIK